MSSWEGLAVGAVESESGIIHGLAQGHDPVEAGGVEDAGSSRIGTHDCCLSTVIADLAHSAY
jgi:hypothetical protein